MLRVVFLPGASLLDRLRWLDSGICAQLATHSFYPGGERLPLCARNTGIYLGFMVTLLTLYATGRGRVQRFPPWPIIIFLLCGVCAMGIDGFNSFLLDLGLPHLYQPNNLLRLATGLATGLALATLTLPAMNHLFWRQYSAPIHAATSSATHSSHMQGGTYGQAACKENEKRSISSWLALLLLVPGLLLSFFAVASQSVLILYPVALLSTAGILTAVSSVNLIVILGISKHDQAFERYRELLPFFSLALVFAIAEMLVLAQLKFSLLQALGM